MSHFRSHLGDAVYAELDEYRGIVLTTDDGFRVTNRIVLEPEVFQAFEEWKFAVDVELRILAEEEVRDG